MIFFEPQQRDRNLFPHDPFKALVTPRPIGWISTVSGKGEINLAPYSYFNAFSSVPPIVGFSSEGEKDSCSRLVKPPRVADSPAAFECRVTEMVRLKDLDGSDSGRRLVLRPRGRHPRRRALRQRGPRRFRRDAADRPRRLRRVQRGRARILDAAAGVIRL